MKPWKFLVIALLPGLGACMSQPERPAPVESGGREVAGEGVQTFGYGESGAGDSGQWQADRPNDTGAAQPMRTAPANLEPTQIAQNAPAGQASSATVESLVQLAEGQERAGNLNGAAATLERSLRIQPRNAVLWYKLATIRFAQGQYGRASSLATKSNSLAAGNASLTRNNWLLIAKAKRAEGDAQGAAEAERRAAGG